MKKFIILDRDGVINYDSDAYIKSPEEWQAIPGSLEAIAQLKQAGYTIAIVTNQAGIAKGLYTEATLIRIHEKMQRELAKFNVQIDRILYCPHQTSDNCECRKPKPGLFLQISEEFKITLKNIPFIGDKKSDIVAAEAVSCQAILVKTGYGEETLANNPNLSIPIFNNLAEAVTAILQDKLNEKN